MLLSLVLACTSPEDDARPDRPRRPRDSGAEDTGQADTSADTSEPGDTSGDTSSDTSDTSGEDSAAEVDPPLGGTSGGSGGTDAARSTTRTSGGIGWWLLAPTGSAAGRAVPLLLVISGTEGGSAMMSNMAQVAPYYGLEDALIAVLDGTRSDAADAATVLDVVRAEFDVDNDRTWLLSESAGTGAGLELAFHERPTWFAAYWANDVNDRDTPAQTAAELGFAPWGNAGPGGDLPDAQAIVDGMADAGWQLPADAPYSGSGSGTHGSSQQFLAAVEFFSDKRR